MLLAQIFYHQADFYPLVGVAVCSFHDSAGYPSSVEFRGARHRNILRDFRFPRMFCNLSARFSERSHLLLHGQGADLFPTCVR